MTEISVVIGTIGRKSLKETLKALTLQLYPLKDFEVIVVSNKDDGLKEFAELLSKKTNLKISFFLHSNKGVTAKRNFGVLNANGKIIAFTDDDCIPEKDWLLKVREAFKNNDVIAVEGKTIGKQTMLFSHAITNLEGKRYPTCNLAVLKEAFLKVKGFDERFTYHRDDADLAFKLLTIGKIFFEPKAIVFHPERRKPFISILKELFLVKGDVLLFKKFPKLYKNHFGFVCRGLFKQAAFSWLMLLLLILGFIYNNFLIILLSVFLILLFRYFVSIKGKKATIFEMLIFIVFSFIRDILFIFSFSYYWLNLKAENNSMLEMA